MSKPHFWVRSNRFKAIPVFISGDWVTLVSLVDDQIDSEKLNAFGFKKTDSGLFGTRSPLNEEDWLTLDRDVEFIPYSDGHAYYTSNANPTPPDIAALTAFVSECYLNDEARFIELHAGVAPDLFWDALDNNELTLETIDAWRSFIQAYAIHHNCEPDDLDLVRDLWNRVKEILGEGFEEAILVPEAVTEQLQEEAFVNAVAGSEVAYYDEKGEQHYGRLARSMYSGDSTVLVHNPEPFWVSGAPVQQHLSLPRDRVRLVSEVDRSPTVEAFQHPLVIPESFVSWAITEGEGSGSLDRLSEYRSYARELHEYQTMSRVREYIDGVLKFEGNELSVNFSATNRMWRVVHSRHGVLLPCTSSDYTSMVRAYSQLMSECTQVNQKVLSNIHLALGGKPISLISAGEWRGAAVSDETPIESLARTLASQGQRLDDLSTLTSILDIEVRLTARPVVSVNVGDQAVDHDSINLYRRSGGGYYIVGSTRTGNVWYEWLGHMAASSNLTFYESPSKAVSSYLEGAGLSEEVIASHSAMQAAVATGLAEEYLTSVAADPGAANKVDLQTYISQKLQGALALQHASPKWVANFTSRITGLITAGNAMIICAFNKRKSLLHQVTEVEVWSKYGGDREKAASDTIAQVRSQRGFRQAEIIIFDHMEQHSPNVRRQINQHFQDMAMQRKAAPKERGTENGKMSDTGFVAGYARKDLYQMRLGDLRDALSDLPSEDLLGLAKVSSVWPMPQWDKYRQSGMPLTIGYAIYSIRKALPTELRSAIGNPTALADYINAVRTLRSTLSTLEDIDDATEAAQNFFKTLGFELEGSRAGYPGKGTILHALSPKWNRAARNHLQDIVLRTPEELSDFWVRYAPRYPEWNFSARRAAKASIKNRRHLTDFPELAELRRDGLDWRKGVDALEEDLIRTFGFTGIEYGNWTNQSERAQYMNQAYDSFADLSDVMGVPKNTMSLGGRVGLTFGSRGRGGRRAAAAHFEPANKAIALTRRNGAGFLAHEFFHAVANYFGTQYGADTRTADLAVIMNNISRRGGVDYSRPSGLLPRGGMRQETIDSFARLCRAIAFKPADQNASKAVSGGPPTISYDLLTEPADWVISSQEQDEEDERETPYWSCMQELFARGMEAWLANRLREEGRCNDYLIGIDRVDMEAKSSIPIYPAGDQLKLISVAADQFFDELRVENRVIPHPIGEQVEVGLMYSRYGGVRVIPKEILADQVLRDVRLILGRELPLAIVDDLRDDLGASVDGSYDPSLKLISLSAQFANLSTARHEIFHAASDLLLTLEEKAMLDEAFSPGGREFEQLVQHLRAHQRKHLLKEVTSSPEEAQAYGFQLYSMGELDFQQASVVARVFQKIIDWLNEVMDCLRNRGFSKVDDLFKHLASGELASQRLGAHAKQSELDHYSNPTVELN